MRKRNRWTRLLAMILAVAMVLSSQSVTALADIQVGAVVDNGADESKTPDETKPADETNSGTNSLPSPEQSAEETVNKPGVISGEGVNIRKGPGTDYEVVTKLQSGDAVTVLTQTTVTNGDGAEEVWYRIQYGTEGAEAYVLSDFVAVSETVEESEPESAEEPQVTAYSNGLSGETIQITCEPTFAAPGEVITLKAEGNVALEQGQKLRWQSASDGTTWKNITGAEEENTETYRFTYSDGNQGYSYRLAVVDEEGNVVAFSNSVSVKRMSPADLAATYYGEGATNPQTMAIVTMFRTDRADGTVYAGGTANFQINYQMNQSPMYKYGDQAKSLVDAYENSHITLTLPQGMTLDSPEKIVGATAKKISQEGAAQETWKFILDASMSTSANNSFGITVKINENGAASAGKEYLIGENDLKIYTEAPVLDKTDSENPTEVARYKQENAASSVPGTLRAGTQDEWGIQKTAGKLADNDRVYSEVNGDKITVYFTLEVGLLGDGKILSESGNYTRVGRVPFENGKISIEDTLTLTDREGKAVYPESVTISENFGSGTYTFTGDQIKEGTVTAESVATDTCGNYNLSDVDANAPYYSVYTVAAVYPYEGIDVDFSENPDEESLTVRNRAVLTYTLKGLAEKTAEDSADISIGSVTKPGTLTIEKKIQPYNKTAATDAKLYTAANMTALGKNAPSGSVTFTIDYADAEAAAAGDPTLYTYNEETKQYSKIQGNTVAIDPESGDGTVKVYLAAGNYTVTETAAPVGAQGSQPQSVELKESEAKTLTFTNKENLGDIKVVKVDEANQPLSGAVFELYSDQDGKRTLEETSVATGTDGSVTFTRLKAGETYYIKEKTAPSGYLQDMTEYPVTVTANTTVTQEVKNVKNAVSVILQKQYVDPKDGQTVNVNAANYTEFNGCFTVEYYDTEAEKWKPVSGMENKSLTTNGTWPVSLPVYEEGTTTEINYRFKENLPE